MKRALVALLLLAAPSLAQASTWEIDSSHTSAEFLVKHMMVSNVRGQLGKVSGTISFDPKDLAKTVVDVSIDVGGIDTRDAKRDEHLKGPDFFDAAKFPTVTFKSKKTVAAGKGKLKITGDLTLHGVTREVTLDVDGPAAEVKDPWGHTKSGATASTVLHRKDFGLTWNNALDNGGVAVSDDVLVGLNVELNKK
jgi:polyisoprenoid-binding protein YceI